MSSENELSRAGAADNKFAEPAVSEPLPGGAQWARLAEKLTAGPEPEGEVDALLLWAVDRGKESLGQGDVASARRYMESSAQAGNAIAAKLLAGLWLIGSDADLGRARRWDPDARSPWGQNNAPCEGADKEKSPAQGEGEGDGAASKRALSPKAEGAAAGAPTGLAPQPANGGEEGGKKEKNNSGRKKRIKEGAKDSEPNSRSKPQTHEGAGSLGNGAASASLGPAASRSQAANGAEPAQQGGAAPNEDQGAGDGGADSGPDSSLPLAAQPAEDGLDAAAAVEPPSSGFEGGSPSAVDPLFFSSRAIHDRALPAASSTPEDSAEAGLTGEKSGSGFGSDPFVSEDAGRGGDSAEAGALSPQNPIPPLALETPNAPTPGDGNGQGAAAPDKSRNALALLENRTMRALRKGGSQLGIQLKSLFDKPNRPLGETRGRRDGRNGQNRVGPAKAQLIRAGLARLEGAERLESLEADPLLTYQSSRRVQNAQAKIGAMPTIGGESRQEPGRSPNRATMPEGRKAPSDAEGRSNAAAARKTALPAPRPESEPDAAKAAPRFGLPRLEIAALAQYLAQARVSPRPDSFAAERPDGAGFAVESAIESDNANANASEGESGSGSESALELGSEPRRSAGNRSPKPEEDRIPPQAGLGADGKTNAEPPAAPPGFPEPIRHSKPNHPSDPKGSLEEARAGFESAESAEKPKAAPSGAPEPEPHFAEPPEASLTFGGEGREPGAPSAYGAGRNIENDPEYAWRMHLELTEKGNAKAADDWLRKAAEGRHEDASLKLGLREFRSDPRGKGGQRALKIFARAAQAGGARAQEALCALFGAEQAWRQVGRLAPGALCEEDCGSGGALQSRRALGLKPGEPYAELAGDAPDVNEPFAKFAAGWMLIETAENDSERALGEKFLASAADLGQPWACARVARRLRQEGESSDGAKNATQAAKLDEIAAYAEHAPSQLSLGFAYLNGDGPRRNLAAAYYWISLAALSGYEPARVAFKALWPDDPQGAVAPENRESGWAGLTAPVPSADDPKIAQADGATLFAWATRLRFANPRDPAAAALARKAAERGSGLALRELGKAHYFGGDDAGNQAKAVLFLEEAAAAGCAEALPEMRALYEARRQKMRSNPDHPRAPKSAFDYLRMYVAGKKKNHLGQLLNMGGDLFPSKEASVSRAARLSNAKAFKFYLLQRSRAGENRASLALGRLHEEGWFGRPNIKLARRCYETALSQKSVEASYDLSRLKRLHPLDETDAKDALSYLERAALQGFSKAQFDFALEIAKRAKTEKEKRLAEEWMQVSSANLCEEAKFLSLMRSLRQIDLSDPKLDLPSLYKLYANLGDPAAQYLYAQRLELGRDRPRDRAQAAMWYEKAARQNHLKAQRIYGMFLLYGVGGRRDVAEAADWLGKARDLGSEESVDAYGLAREILAMPEDDRNALLLETEIFEPIGDSSGLNWDGAETADGGDAADFEGFSIDWEEEESEADRALLAVNGSIDEPVDAFGAGGSAEEGVLAFIPAQGPFAPEPAATAAATALSITSAPGLGSARALDAPGGFGDRDGRGEAGMGAQRNGGASAAAALRKEDAIGRFEGAGTAAAAQDDPTAGAFDEELSFLPGHAMAPVARPFDAARPGHGPAAAEQDILRLMEEVFPQDGETKIEAERTDPKRSALAQSAINAARFERDRRAREGDEQALADQKAGVSVAWLDKIGESDDGREPKAKPQNHWVGENGFESGARLAQWMREKGKDSATQWLKRAAAEGSPAAMLELSRLLRQGFGGAEPDPKTAESWLLEAMRRGHPESQYEVGAKLLGQARAKTADANPSAAAAADADAGAGAGAEAGFIADPAASLADSLGAEPEKGNGAETRDEKSFGALRCALILIQQAATKGWPPAQRTLGELFLRGVDLPQNKQMAFHWIVQAAGAEDPQALRLLGDLSSNGAYLRPDARAAQQWYRQAVKLGDPVAALRLANLLYQGGGVGERRPKEAEELWRYAADKAELGEALHMLAVIYGGGDDGVPVDVEKSIGYLKRGAEAGYALSQLNLGELLMSGASGLERNVTLARMWLRKAAKQGQIEAIALLRKRPN